MPTAAATFEDLSPDTRRRLHVRVPVSVTLASKKQPLKQILELGPGSIIQFPKSCEDPLELCVGHRPIAQGVAVKVGDKFGLRISAISPPQSVTS